MLILGTGAPAYVGPLDLVGGALVAYSQRALAAAWVSNAITIRRDSDDTTASFATTSSNAVDAAAVAAFIGGGNGFASAWLDQSGNAVNALQATGANQPLWKASATGGRPSFVFSSADFESLVSSADVSLPAGTYDVFFVAKFGTITGTFVSMALTADPFSYVNIGYSPSHSAHLFITDAYDGNSGNEAGGETAGIVGVPGTYGVGDLAWELNSTAPMTWNGVDYGNNNTYHSGVPGAFDVPICIGTNAAFGTTFDGELLELIVYPSVLSAPNRLAIVQNIAAYYGLSLGSYVGPLDIVAGIAAFSQRAMSAAKLGTALYTIRRDSDDTTQSFSSNVSSGVTPVASIASFIGSAFNQTGATVDTVADVVMASVTGIAVGQAVSGDEIDFGSTVLAISGMTVTLSLPAVGTNPTATLSFVPLGYASVWADQAGTVGNLVQATLVDQPAWKANAANQRSGFIDNASGVAMFTGAFGFAGGALYAAMVCNITIADGPVLFTLDTNAGGHPNVISLGTFYNVEGDLSLIVGASAAEWASTTALADGLHLIEMWIDGAGNVTMFADGADAGATLQAGALTAIAPEAAMVVEYPSRQSGGDVTQLEIAIWDTIPSAPNRLAIRQNMAAFYGITLA